MSHLSMKMTNEVISAELESLRLQKELKDMKAALPTQTAAYEIIEYIRKADEPLIRSNDTWRDNNACCIIS